MRSIRTLALPALFGLSACEGTPPPSTLRAGGLLPCPSLPHCVSTHPAEPESRRIAPVPFTGAPAVAQQRARLALVAEARTTIVEERAGYIRAAVPSRIFRFVDDVELFVDSTARQMQLRSSARLGYTDLGVNRARMERVTRRLAAPR